MFTGHTADSVVMKPALQGHVSSTLHLLPPKTVIKVEEKTLTVISKTTGECSGQKSRVKGLEELESIHLLLGGI